jgi:hypothetical protein
MSTLAVNTITNAAGGNTAQINGMTPTADSLQGFRNRIINGDMRIDQRNAGASVTVTDAYTTDRWEVRENTDGAITAQQVSDAPSGFINSLKITTTTADASLTTDQILRVTQPIEGLNISDFAFGTASASAVTLSFWVKSSLTGTYAGVYANSASNRSYVFTYVIDSANTWEQKSVAITGDTTGTWVTTNARGAVATFSLGAASSYNGTAGVWTAADVRSVSGAVSVIGTLSATWQVTGVQLEAGSVATPFERRPYGTELALCQRYYEKSYNMSVVPGTTTDNGAATNGGVLTATTTGTIAIGYAFRVPKRANPTMTAWDVNGNINKCDRSQFGVTGTPNQAVSFTWSAENSFLAESSGTATANGIRMHFTAVAEL